jgi:hypothetical protein
MIVYIYLNKKGRKNSISKKRIERKDTYNIVKSK